MTTVNTRLTQAVLEHIQAWHPNTRLSQAVLEVILPSGVTPPPDVVYTRVSQAVLEILTPRGSSYLPNRTLVYDIVADRWHSDSRGFTAYYDEGTAGNLLAGQGTAFVQLDAGDVDTDALGNVSRIPVIWQSGFHNQGAPENPKVYADIVIDACTNGAPLTVRYQLDCDDATDTPLGSVLTVAGEARRQFTFALGADNLGVNGRSISVKIEGSAPLAQPVIVYSVGVHYYLEARPAQTFDCGWGDWGSPNVKQVDLVELDIDAPGGITLHLFSDLAAQAPASCAVPATSGHTKILVPISKFAIDQTVPDYFEGRMIRFAGSTEPDTVGADDNFTPPFQLWAARARYRDVGVYVNGLNGEEWLTFPDGLGEFALVKLARIIELDCETTAGLTLNVRTDLPGNAMATRQAIQVAAAGRRTQRFRVPGSLKGKLWQFQFLPAGILRLYGMRVYAKALASGEDWRWYVIPLPVTSTEQQWKDLPVAA